MTKQKEIKTKVEHEAEDWQTVSIPIWMITRTLKQKSLQIISVKYSMT